MSFTETSNSTLGSRFEELKILGQGAAGSVYKVFDRQRGEIVALKLLANKFAFLEGTEQRFLEEIKTCIKLEHKNLVKAYEGVFINGMLGFTMELIDGCHLLQYLSNGRPDPVEITSIMSQLLDGLQAMHEKKIVHRDIKLENILIKENGEIKLSDLGLLKNLETAGLTKPGMILGSPVYMAPEYVLTGKYDERSDLYACGIILFELLKGSRRLIDPGESSIIECLIKNNFKIEALKLPSEYLRFQSVLSKALAKNPNSRYQSAKEMKSALLEEQKPAQAGWISRLFGFQTPAV